MSVHLWRRRTHRRSLSVARLSDMSWTAADRKAWREAYREACAIAVERDGWSPAAVGLVRDVHSVHAGWYCDHGYYRGESCPSCDVPSWMPEVVS